jgi:hypothetical protein
MTDADFDIWAQQWLGLMNDRSTMTPAQVAVSKPEAYCADIKLVTTNAKYRRLNKRKQKKMVDKLPTKSLTNCYPSSVSPLVENPDGTVDMTVFFDSPSTRISGFAESTT